jgi:hypothetical protein
MAKKKAKAQVPPAPADQGGDTEPTREELAHHEAGHAVVGYLLGEPIVRVTIKRQRVDGRESYGHVRFDSAHVPALIAAIDYWAGPLAVDYYQGFDPGQDVDFDMGLGIPIVLYGFPELPGEAAWWFLDQLARAGRARCPERRRGRGRPGWPYRLSQITCELLYVALVKLGRRLAIDLMRTRKVQRAIEVVARRLLKVEELDGPAVGRLLAPRLKPLFRWVRPAEGGSASRNNGVG